MVVAYILIIADSGYEKKIIDALSDVDGVEDIDMIYGEYDLIAKINVDDVSALGDFVIEKIRPVQGVRRTSTLISVE